MIRRIIAAAIVVSLLGLAPPARAAQSTWVTPGSPLPMTALKSFLDAALLAVGTCSSGSSAPTVGPATTPTAQQCWWNTATTPWVLEFYDGSQWVPSFTLNTSTHTIGLNATTTINGTSCALFGSCSVTATAASVTVGTTTVLSGTSGRVLYDNAGVLGELTVTGTGSAVLSASPTMTGQPTINGTLQLDIAGGGLNIGITDNGAAYGALTSGTGNLAISPSAANSCTSCSYNILLGYGAGGAITTGSDNIIIGAGSGGVGGTLTTGGSNVLIGGLVNFPATGSSNLVILADGGGQVRFDYGYTNSGKITLTGAVIATGAISASNLSLGGTLTTAAALTTTGAGAPTLAFPSSGFTYTFPGATANLAYQVGALTGGHCLQASGTAGGVADAGAACGSGSTSITANSTPTSGFSAGQLLYSDGSLVQATAGVTYGGTGQVTNALGTITSTTRALTITATNNASVSTLIAAPLLVNVTLTSGGTQQQGSTLAEIQANGIDAFAVYTSAGTDSGGHSAPQVLINSVAAAGQAPFTGDWSSHRVLDVQGLGGIIVHAYNGQIAQLNLATLGGSTLASPTAVVSGADIGVIQALGSDGSNTATQRGVWFGMVATVNWDATHHGARLDIQTTDVTASAAAIVNFRLWSDGGLTIGNAQIGTDPGAGNLLLSGGGLLLQGSSTGYTTLTTANSGSSNFTVTIQASTDTLVGRATTDTLTNKTIAFASNTLTGVAPLASPTFTGTVTMPDASTFGTNFAVAGNAILTGPAAATLHLGAADAASPVAQTLGVQGVVAGTSNTAGTLLVIAGSQGTGTGAGGSIQFMVAPAGTSGTSQNSLVNAFYISSVTTASSTNNRPQIAIGTTSPDSASIFSISGNATAPPLSTASTYIHVTGKDTTATGMEFDTFAQQTFFIMRRAGGTNASPAATENGVMLGSIQGRGYDTAYVNAASASVAFVTSQLWASGAHGTQIGFYTTVNSTSNPVEAMRLQNSGGLTLGNGILTTDPGAGNFILSGSIQVGSPTGGSEGAGTINVASGIYLNGTAYTNPDYALESYYTGRIERFANNPGASSYRGLLPLDRLDDYMRAHDQLPGMDRVRDRPVDIFERADMSLEKVEEATIYIVQLNVRLNALQAANENLQAEVTRLRAAR